ncbi:MAG TPA: CCA tRNA nucleotidyltransferase, partial [Rhabdaerophilum sp.]|nr:CCA tRNA nucleotidyltransferase [Rhabdaerophilum sp.]
MRQPAVGDILALLAGAGEETRVVGGALRNALLRIEAKDIDFVTTRVPQDVMRIGITGGWHVVPTGIDHGTVSLVRDGQVFEITTLREDIDTDGRRATVRFGRDFQRDAARRDFTINA